MPSRSPQPRSQIRRLYATPGRAVETVELERRLATPEQSKESQR